MDKKINSKILELSKLDNLLYLDLETTGLDTSSDKIVEIAMVNIRGQERLEYQSLVNPGRLIPIETSKINSIYNDMVEKAPLFKILAKEVLEFLDDSIIVCHNAKFDLPILFREIKSNISVGNKEFYYIDTLYLARKFFNFDSNSLTSLSLVLDIETSIRHRAMADVETLIAVSRYLFSNIARKGVETIEIFPF